MTEKNNMPADERYCRDCIHNEVCRWYPHDGCEFKAKAEPDKGWISVKDRLPDDNGKYIVWADGELNICEYDVESQTFGDTFYDYDEMYSKLLCWDDYINKLVTHWLPLFEPPKGE